jgi:hypothetical protein
LIFDTRNGIFFDVGHFLASNRPPLKPTTPAEHRMFALEPD